MKQLFFLFIISASLFTACNNTQEKAPQLKRIVFDPGHLQFIASAVNRQHQTVSALYGNNKAYQSLNQQDSLLGAEGELKLVTWRFHENPQYYGGTINGELLYIETVRSDKKNGLSYFKKEIAHLTSDSQPLKQRDRIAYIMGYRPVSFP